MPTGLKQLRGFLGLTGYYKRFVKGYGSICKPLTQLLKKKATGWNKDATEAFNQLKKVMTSAPVLALPDFNKTFIVETDASIIGVRAVLMQEGHPIAFLSKSLGPKSRLCLYTRGKCWLFFRQLPNGSTIFGDAILSSEQITSA
jgi:hypothetical protein